MKTLSYSVAYNTLTTYASNATYRGIAETLANVVQHALQDKNVQLDTLIKIRNMTDKGVKQLQIAIGKTMPISWDKENRVYTFSNSKRDELVDEIGIKVNTEKGQKLTPEEKQSNLESIHAWLLEQLCPEEKPKATPTAKAWTESQYKAQAAKLTAMDNDQLAAQLKMLQALLTQAQHEQDTRITSFLGAKPTATTPEQLADVC